MARSSLPIPEAVASILAICQKHLGSVGSPERVEPGSNSRLFRVPLDEDRIVVVKFYRRDLGDKRDRLATEFGALQFLWENGVRRVPRAIAKDLDHYCAIYEYIEGQSPVTDVGEADIASLVEFLAALQPLRKTAGGARIGNASEANFSLSAVAEHVRARADRLKSSAPELAKWFATSFEPLWIDVKATRKLVDEEIDESRRTLSPSDFGFHNAIRRPDGSLAFVDFEYFGWDDPAKTVVDFLFHPGMALSETLKKAFAERFFKAFEFVPGLRERARVVYPLYGLKWCLILLNDFLPDRATTATQAVREAQLQKAARLTDRIRGEYRENPFV